MPLIEVLAEMELAGIRILSPELAAYSREMERDLARIEEEIYALCGRKFNIASTKQLQEILFTWRKLTPVKKTKTGFSTDMDVLEVLAAQDPVPEKILAHRKLSKLKSTYVDALPLLVNEQTGRLHTHYVQTGTATGRLSSKDPNLQNIPIREEEGRRIRSAFVPAAGMRFVSADYAQIELAVMAYLSKDPILLEAFREGRDIHRQTASLIFGAAEGEVTPEQRRVGKTINFGVIYGQTAYGLSQASEDRQGRGGAVHPHVLPALRGSGPFPEGDHPPRRGDRVRRDPPGQAAEGERHPQPEQDREERGREGRRQLADPGHRRRPREARDDGSVQEAEARGARLAHPAAGARRDHPRIPGRGGAGRRGNRP